MRMRSGRPAAHFAFLVATILALSLAACAKPAPSRRYTVQGQVTALSPATGEATIKHEAIAGFMPAMTMPYRFKNRSELEALKPGDLMTGTLVVQASDAWIEQVRKTGEAPLEAAPQSAADASPAARSGFELLKPGEAIPVSAFTDQAGRPTTLARMKGAVTVITFTYTRCPMPTFCPLMDRHFLAIQKAVKADARLNGHVQLATVSFDPDTDTPAVLAAHGKALGADPGMWTFLTGSRDDVDRFAARFGVSVMRGNDPLSEITHNLRTAVVDQSGTLVKIYTGNDWTPEQIVTDARALVATR